MNEPDFQPIACGRTLLVSWGVPPDIQGSSAIAEKFSWLFEPSACMLAGEASPEARDYQRDPELPPVRYLAKRWPWRGRNLMRRLSFPLLCYRLWRLTGKEKFDRIVGVFPDETYLLAAYYVARWRGIEFWLFWHNTYIENRAGFLKWLAERMQPTVFANSSIMLVANDGMKRYYEKAYPGHRFETVHHINEVPPPPPSELPPPHAPLRLAYVGSLNWSNDDAFLSLGRTIGPRDDYHLTIYSGQPASAFAQLGFPAERMSHTSVPYQELPEALSQHDVLLLPHGFEGGTTEIEYQTIFPTRTIPCLLSGRPILAHTPPGCFVTDWLREYDCAEVVDVKDPAAVTAALERLAHDEDRRRELVANARRAVACFDPGAVADHLRSLFLETWQQPATTSESPAEAAASSATNAL